jgi:hypothetical protein
VWQDLTIRNTINQKIGTQGTITEFEGMLRSSEVKNEEKKNGKCSKSTITNISRKSICPIYSEIFMTDLNLKAKTLAHQNPFIKRKTS